MQKRNFKDFIEAYLEYSSGHEATRKIHLWTILSVLAGAMERKVWMDRVYYTLFPNLYVFIIGKSGLIKKSTSTSIGMDLLRELPDMKFMSERLTAASLIDQMHRAKKNFDWKEEVVSQSPLYAYASELLVLMNEVYGQTTELLTTFYDCQPNDSTKPWVYKARHQEAVKIHGPCLNILGCSTESWLRKCIPVSEMEGGFTARAVFVVESDGPDEFIAWPKKDSKRAAMKGALIDDLMHIYEMTGEVQVTQPMKKEFSEWYNYHMKHIVKPNKDPRFTGYLARKGDLLLKLSMIRSVTLRDDLIVTPAHFNWAGEVLNEAEAGMFKAFKKEGNITEMRPPVGKPIVSTFEVQDYIRVKEPVSRQDLADYFVIERNDQALSIALADLVSMNYISVRDDESEQVFVYKGPTTVKKATDPDSLP
ncbi:MAG: DUF3987 domain-containing protein [Desulfobacteraceae bacterium]|nr:DUF3987 domain-containing protein [Desulfobacteraceae bacterium]